MRIFSNRNRSFTDGPFPVETLPRSARVSRPDSFELTPSDEDDRREPSFTSAVPIYLELLSESRRTPVAAAQAPLQSEARALENLKGYAYFLDADVAGVCRVPEDAWTGERDEGQTHALAIAVFRPRPARPHEPGSQWILGGGSAAADLRVSEIATLLARYLATLGFSATAHTRTAEDVDRLALAWRAGVVEWTKDGLTHPFAKHGVEIAVVTTDLALPVDQPLAPRGAFESLRARAVFLSGARGTRPGWSRLSGEEREWHLSAYPMERLERPEDPTTLILEDEITPTPKRHAFFMRAGMGDLGPKPQREFARFIAKAPHGAASMEVLGGMAPLSDGPVSEKIAPDLDDPDANALAVKSLGHFLGLQLTAVCDVPEYAWYTHHLDGSPITRRHRNAIVFVIDQGRETMEGASGDDWISGAQSMRAYLRIALLGGVIARHIRGLGYEAKSYDTLSDELHHIPLLLRAGIGELSRIGEVVLNPFVGPRFKSGIVSTNLPMTPDRAVDFGLQDFCAKCNKCARECPVGAIRFGEKTMFNGYEMWKPDVHRCASYRVTNSRGSACGRCMKTCPYNLEGVLAERPFQWLAMNVPAARGWIARLDDRVRNGSLNPKKKWWIDIEVVDGLPVAPIHGANERDLQPESRERSDETYAIFPPEHAPRADQTGSVKVDRKLGIEAARRAETPSQARARRSRR